MNLVVNASPLVFLGNAGRLELLRELGGGRIAVPSVVLQEVISSSHRDRASSAVEAATWIEAIQPLEIPTALARWGLDPGEEQVIAAGLATPRVRLVVDDLAGRKCALAHRLELIGTLGVVVAAHRRGLVDDPARVLAELETAGMWLSPSVIARALAIAKATS